MNANNGQKIYLFSGARLDNGRGGRGLFLVTRRHRRGRPATRRRRVYPALWVRAYLKTTLTLVLTTATGQSKKKFSTAIMRSARILMGFDGFGKYHSPPSATIDRWLPDSPSYYGSPKWQKVY